MVRPRMAVVTELSVLKIAHTQESLIHLYLFWDEVGRSICRPAVAINRGIMGRVNIFNVEEYVFIKFLPRKSTLPLDYGIYLNTTFSVKRPERWNCPDGVHGHLQLLGGWHEGQR